MLFLSQNEKNIIFPQLNKMSDDLLYKCDVLLGEETEEQITL